MKKYLLPFVFLFTIFQTLAAQEIEDPINFIQWKNVVLNNNVEFKKLNRIQWGSGFLMHFNNQVIACTARDLLNGVNNSKKILLIDDFEKELLEWRMFIPDNPSEYVIMDSLVMRKRIEKTFSVFSYSMPFLTFGLKEQNEKIIPLKPDTRKIKNGETLYLVGYDDDHNLKIIEGLVETPLNEKYADPEIRVKTDEFLYYPNYVGAPIVDRLGSVVGMINRSYWLKKNKRGKIIKDSKEEDGAYYEYFVNGISIRAVLGKNYGQE